MRFHPFLLFLALASCADYDVKVNEKVVYSPPKLFSDFKIADKSLQTCVQQTIEEQGITKSAQLTQLACTNGNISSLAGIERFTELQQLNLNNNALQDVSVLADLPALQTLLLASNEIRTVATLRESTALLKLNVENNANLNCETVIDLMNQLPALQARMPKQCVAGVK